MKTELKPLTHSGKQRGAALVVGLVLLVVVTVLAISGMNTATTELAIARNDQNFENAFQAAETGLELALSQGFFTTVPPETTLAQYNITENAYSVNTNIEFDTTTLVPDKAFSLGVGSGIAAYHFVAEATAESTRVAGGDENDRDASAFHTQAFYIVGPGSPTL
jgi:type IV pilus assembly protein PilX